MEQNEMKTLNRVVKIRLASGNDVTRNYPVFRYDSLTEAIREHGEYEILEAFHYVRDLKAMAEERMQLLASVRMAEENL
jgi:hypothetical protein